MKAVAASGGDGDGPGMLPVVGVGGRGGICVVVGRVAVVVVALCFDGRGGGD